MRRALWPHWQVERTDGGPANLKFLCAGSYTFKFLTSCFDFSTTFKTLPHGQGHFDEKAIWSAR